MATRLRQLRPTSVGIAAAVVIAVSTAGCAANKEAKSAAPAYDASDATTATEEQADGERGEGEDAAGGDALDGDDDRNVTSAPDATVEQLAAELAADEKRLSAIIGDGDKREQALSGGQCDDACRALSSMQRSAERLCSLTAEDDARCQDVRGRVAKARERVEAACPSCEV